MRSASKQSRHRIPGLLPVLGFLASLVLHGCSDSQGDRVQRTRTGDTLSVHSLSPQVPDTLIPREVLRIGQREGSLDYIFNQIFSFTVSPSGDVFVQDEGEGIRRFDSRGRFLGHLARQGEGPSEVRYVLGLTADAAGRVAAYDLGNARITLFNEDGTIRTVRRPDGRPGYADDALLFLQDGSLWVAITPVLVPDGGVTHPRPVFARVSDTDAFVDTIFTPASLGELCPMLSTRQNRAGFWEDRREPYFPKAKWSLGPNGDLAFGCSGDYSFDLVRVDGSVLRLSRPWTPHIVPEEQKDFMVKWGILPRVPSELPAYARVVIPGDGRVWVWPTQPNMKVPLSPEQQESFGETHTWLVSWEGSFDVFGENGEWLAVVKLPEEARYSGYPTEPDVFIRGDTIWAVALDAFDVQYVVRYQVDGIPRGDPG